MNNFIPSFIEEKVKGNLYDGNFNGAVLILDIKGFSEITDSLVKYGKEGSETISIVLEKYFNEIINIISGYGGFVSCFAGDSITVIFKGSQCKEQSIYSSIKIRELFIKNPRQKTKFGKVNFSVKISIAYGRINWSIPGKGDLRTYFFKGPAIFQAASLQRFCESNTIIFNNEFFSSLKNRDDYNIQKIKSSIYKVINKNSGLPPVDIIKQPKIDKNISKLFFPQDLLEFEGGEYRDIISVFISIPQNLSRNTFKKKLGDILELTKIYGGYFNSLEYGDKGLLAFVIFGAPVSFENNIERSLRFVLSLKKVISTNIGLTFGRVYCGIIGNKIISSYTAIGDNVNLAARFMTSSEKSGILVTKKIAESMDRFFQFKSLGKKSIKGKKQKVDVFTLVGEKERPYFREFSGKFIGRSDLLKELIKRTDSIFHSEFGGVVYVYGDAGMGKSRLISELIMRLQEQKPLKVFTVQGDSVDRKSYSAFYNLFSQIFHQNKDTNISVRKNIFNKIYSELINDLKKLKGSVKFPEIKNELIRIKSIIGSLIGLRWESSIFEKIDDKDKNESVLFAVREFFRIQSLLKPVILVLEDLHWLDKETGEIFKILTRDMSGYPIIIISASRYNDDGSTPVLSLDSSVETASINLDYFSMNEIKNYIESLLNSRIDSSLINFIREKTGGNAFYIEQFIYYLQENSFLAKKSGRIILLKKETDLPSEVNSIIISRIDRFTKELKDLIFIASVLGREFDVIILSEMLKNKDPKVLLRYGEEERIWELVSELKYIFKHAILRDVVYEMQLKHNLIILHRLAAETFLKLFKNDYSRYSDIGYHFERSGAAESARKYYTDYADYLLDLSSHDNAKEYYLKALALLKRGREREQFYYYRKLGIIATEKADFKTALEYLHKQEHLAGKYSKEFSEELPIIYKNQADVLRETGDTNAAFEKLKAAEELTGNKSKDNLIEIYANYGLLNQRLLNFKEALRYFKKALSLSVKHKGADSIRAGMLSGNIALVYTKLNNFSDAMIFTEKSIRILGHYKGKTDLDISKAMHTKGLIFLDTGKYKQAYKIFEKVLKTHREIFGNNHPDIASVLINIGSIYYYQGYYEKGLDYYKKALQIRKSIYGEKHREIYTTLLNIGAIYTNLLKLDKAQSIYNDALKIGTELLGKDNVYMSFLYNNMGDNYFRMKDYKNAYKYLILALDLFKKFLGEEHNYTAMTLNNLGSIYFYTGKMKKAETFYLKSLNIRLKCLGPDHIETGQSYTCLGDYYIKAGNKKKAREFYSNAIRVAEKNNDKEAIESLNKKI